MISNNDTSTLNPNLPSNLTRAFVLSDSASTDEVAHTILKALSLLPQEKRIVQILSTAGWPTDARFKRLITLLYQAGVRVTGSLISPADFAKEVSSLTETLLEVRTARQKHKSFTEKFNSLKQHALGLPHGFTFLEHMWTPHQPESKWLWQKYRGWRFATARKAFHQMGVQSALFGIGTMIGVSLLTHWGSPHSIREAIPSLVISSTILSIWVYLFTAYQRETMSFKKQGTHVTWDEFRKPGEQLIIRHNKTVFSLISLSQEVVIGWLIMAAVAGPSYLAWEDYLNILVGAIAGAYSYIPPETALSKILDKAHEAESRGDRAEHDRQLKRYVFWMRAWWWGAYTLLRNVPLLLPASTHGLMGLWASTPLVAAGTLGWILDVANDHPHLFKHLRKWVRASKKQQPRILLKLAPNTGLGSDRPC